MIDDRRFGIPFLAAVLLVSCAASTGTRSATPSSSHSRVLVYDEMHGSGAINALDAVYQLRSNWLLSSRARGAPDPQLIVNQAPRGSLDYLRTIPVNAVREIRFVSARDATVRWGTGYSGGAIHVITRVGSAGIND